LPRQTLQAGRGSFFAQKRAIYYLLLLPIKRAITATSSKPNVNIAFKASHVTMPHAFLVGYNTPFEGRTVHCYPSYVKTNVQQLYPYFTTRMSVLQLLFCISL